MKTNASWFTFAWVVLIGVGGWYVWQLASRVEDSETKLDALTSREAAHLRAETAKDGAMIEVLLDRIEVVSEDSRKDLGEDIETTRLDGERSVEAVRKQLGREMGTVRQDLDSLAGRLDALEEEGGDPHTMPVAVVTAFFKAMETDDRKAMTRLMTPGRAERMERPGAWDAWLALWKRFSVIRVGEVLTEKGADGNLPERVKVLVEYREGERTLKDSVTVSRIDGRWYWDEN